MTKKIDLRPRKEKIREIFLRMMLWIGITLVAFGLMVQFIPGWSMAGVHWFLMGIIFILIASMSGSGWFSNFPNGTRFKH